MYTINTYMYIKKVHHVFVSGKCGSNYLIPNSNNIGIVPTIYLCGSPNKMVI